MSYEQRQALLRGTYTTPYAKPPPVKEPYVYEGFVEIEILSPDGRVQRASGWNAAVSYGMSRLADFIATVTAAASGWMNYLAIGTGTAAPTSNDASLVASTGSGSASKSVAGVRSAQYTASFNSNNPAGAATIAEVGLFQTDTFSGSMAARATLSPVVTKGASDTIRMSRPVEKSAGENPPHIGETRLRKQGQRRADFAGSGVETEAQAEILLAA